MTFKRFDEYVLDLMTEMNEVRETKGKEYAGGEDRFGNFNRIAARCGVSRQVVWLVFFTKHLDSIETFIREGKLHSDESIQKRIVDAVAYLTLLGGMIEEDTHKPKPPAYYEVKTGFQARRDQLNPEHGR